MDRNWLIDRNSPPELLWPTLRSLFLLYLMVTSNGMCNYHSVTYLYEIALIWLQGIQNNNIFLSITIQTSHFHHVFMMKMWSQQVLQTEVWRKNSPYQYALLTPLYQRPLLDELKNFNTLCFRSVRPEKQGKFFSCSVQHDQ